MSIWRSFDLHELDDSGRRAVRDVVDFDRAHVVEATLDDGAQSLRVAAHSDEALDDIAKVVAAAKDNQRRLRRKVLHVHEVQREVLPADVDRALRDCGETFELGDGLVGIRGDALQVFRYFEAEFAALARRWAADENHYPVLVPVELLAELQYFSHFPQHVTFCSHLPEDLPLLERLASEAADGDGGLSAGMHAQLAPPGHVLKPAVCLPCYPQHRGRCIPAGEVLAVTMQNHVFRYEGRRVHSLERLWDFSVRDVVFFGAGPALERIRAEVMAESIELCRALDLDARIELANDPFFLDESRHKSVYQRLGEVKYELTLDLPQRGHRLAAASFNLHRDYYTQIFSIRSASGGRAESACMGFGLERWTYAFLSQQGRDRHAWPERLRAWLERNEGDRGTAAERLRRDNETREDVVP